ncbi:hypothetical protein ERO13_D07G132001v2 [Gossypium hirsutum]|nr:hypothetical protein ERO13_D07G132001v2 [Gossypium hirsutum]
MEYVAKESVNILLEAAGQGKVFPSLPLAYRLILNPLHLKQISVRIKMEIVLYLTVHIFPGLIVACLCILYINFYSRGLSLCFEQEILKLKAD